VRAADALIEFLVGGLFAWVTYGMLASLRRAGNLNVRNTLALSLISIFALSAPHRIVHAMRLVLDRSQTDVVSLTVDAAILVGLGWYALNRSRFASVIVPEEREHFAVFADMVGLENLRTRLRRLDSDLALETAKQQTLIANLRAVVPPMEELRAVAMEIYQTRDVLKVHTRLGVALQRLDAVQDLMRIVGPEA
jgi:hypothetical protein